MGQNKINLSFIWLLPLLHLSSSTESLDAILHEHAVRIMTTHRHHHTDELYNVALPAYLAGMQASVISLRSRTLWRKGANFSHITIPANTLPVPHVKRLLIVYHNLGNWSSSYYSLPGYKLSTPVIGFHVYDASNLSKVELNTNRKAISVDFNGCSVSDRRNKCAVFGADGGVFVSEMRSGSRCYSRSEGHFSVVIPVRKKETRLLTWTMGFVAGFMGLILVGVAGVMAVRSLVYKKNQEMADEGECLQSNWIGSSKMPRAEVTRTHPVLESTTLPNPKMSWYT